jgi:DNA-binding Xre family transcriptional regulator
MKLSKKEKVDNIKSNISYALKSRNETKKSFSERTGITRTTIYNILDGKVDRIQTQTVEKIANFFGTTCSVIEEDNLEAIEYRNQLVSPDGNKNPLCIPILNERGVINSLDKYIGELIVSHPTTYYFSDASNIIGLNITTPFTHRYQVGAMLVIERFKRDDIDDLVVLTSRKSLRIESANYTLRDGEVLIGCVREERLNAK